MKQHNAIWFVTDTSKLNSPVSVEIHEYPLNIPALLNQLSKEFPLYKIVPIYIDIEEVKFTGIEQFYYYPESTDEEYNSLLSSKETIAISESHLYNSDHNDDEPILYANIHLKKNINK